MVAIVRASPRKRSANPGSSINAGSRTFTATVRPSTSSVPRQTSPMPPPAMRSSRRYRPPSVVPGLNIADTSLRAPFVDDRLHHAARDLCRVAATVGAGPLEEHGHRRDRLPVLDGEADEPSVVAVLAVFRRAGLATDLHAVDASGLACAVVDDAAHHVAQGVGGLRADRLSLLLLLRHVGGRAVAGQLLVDQV